MPASINLFPDANFFFHCKDLGQIDWHSHPDLASFDEIHLIVCNPVHMEIDKHKYESKGRVGRRAKKLNSLLRGLIQPPSGTHIVRSDHPHVILEEANALQPSKSLDLDYSLMDHRTLGCVQTYNENLNNSPAYLFTNDGSAMAMAINQNIRFIGVPDEWRLPPENSAAERSLVALQEENERLRRTEPAFNIALRNSEGNTIDSIEVEYEVFQPLSDCEISELLDTLRHHFPAGLRRASRDRAPNTGKKNVPGIASSLRDLDLGPLGSGEPARLFRRDSHACREWIAECELVLKRLHIALQVRQERVEFSFAAANVGTRPAADALVQLTVTEPFSLIVPTNEDSYADDYLLNEEFPCTLPTPPPLGLLLRSSFASESFLSAISPVLGTHDHRINRRRGDFYYEADRPVGPTELVSLECEQWMHGLSSEFFPFEVHVDSVASDTDGATTCKILASNQSEAVWKTFRIHVLVRPAPTKERAEELIERLVKNESEKTKREGR